MVSGVRYITNSLIRIVLTYVVTIIGGSCADAAIARDLLHGGRRRSMASCWALSAWAPSVR